MESTITHTNQERLSEEQHVPRRNGEAVDEVEGEHASVNYPAAIRSAARNEPAETHEHYHDKASANGAVEPTISFHFAPGAKLALRLTQLEDSGESTIQVP